jgi:hypothetical protein
LVQPDHLLAQLIGLAAYAGVFTAFAHKKGFDGSWTDVFGAMGFYARIILHEMQVWDWSAVLGIALLLPLGAVWIANRFLPQPLRFQPPERVEDLAREVAKLSGQRAHGDDFRGRCRWARTRLYGGLTPPALTILVLRRPDLWSAADAERLREFVSLRPADRSLVVIVLIRGPTEIASGLLYPWLDNSGQLGREARSIGAVELLALPPSAVAAQGSVNDLSSLLGADDSDHDKTGELLDAIRDPRWTRHDLLPMLVTGSTSESPFVVELDLLGRDPPLDETTAAFARIFSKEGVNPHGIFGDSAWEREHAAEWVRAQANRAASVILVRRRGKGDRPTRYELIGRADYADVLVDALRGAFGDDEEGRLRYVRKLRACGELYNLLAIARLLGEGTLDRERGERAVRHMRAACELRRRRAGAGLGEQCVAQLREAWRAVAETADRVDVIGGVDSGVMVTEFYGLLLRTGAKISESSARGGCSGLVGIERSAQA